MRRGGGGGGGMRVATSMHSSVIPICSLVSTYISASGIPSISWCQKRSSTEVGQEFCCIGYKR